MTLRSAKAIAFYLTSRILPVIAEHSTAITAKRYLHISFHYPPPMSELEAAHRIQPIIKTADELAKIRRQLLDCLVFKESAGLVQ
jgi:hypothetical protein